MSDTCKFYDLISKSNVKIKSHDGSVYQGKTLSLDGYLNISLESVLFYEDGVQEPIFLSTIFVKGSNIEYISICDVLDK